MGGGGGELGGGGGGIDPPPHPKKKLPSKSPALLGLIMFSLLVDTRR